MRAVVQRVSRASVTVDGETVGAIKNGLLVLLGVENSDAEEDARYITDKAANLRIFEDGEGKMNRSVLETGGAILLVSQFTLHGDARKGRRPSFSTAARPETANALYETCAQLLREAGLPSRQAGFRRICRWSSSTTGRLRFCWTARNCFRLGELP